MKKVLSIVLSLVLLITLFAGCTNGTAETENEVTSNGAAAESTSNDKETEESVGETAEKPREVELDIMMSFPQHMEHWEKYAEQFEAKVLAEDNIAVTINLEMPSSDQYESILQARLTGDDAPDLYSIHANNLTTYNDAGYLTDLSSEPLADKLYDNVRGTVTIDGQLLAVPLESLAWNTLYNKEIFDAAGVTPPNTLDELKDVVDVLTEKGYTPFVVAMQDQWVPQLMTAVTLGGKVTGDVPDWLTRMYNDEGSYEEVRQIFDVIDLVYANGTNRAMETGFEAGCVKFAQGEGAIWVQGTWAAGTILEVNPDAQIGVFPLPINNNENCSLINLATSTTLAVYPDSEEKELALKFANYVLDDNDSSALFEACVFNPIASCHTFESSSWIAEATSYVEMGRSYQDLVLPNAVTDEQGKLLQEYYVGTVTQDEFIERLDKAFQNANKEN